MRTRRPIGLVFVYVILPLWISGAVTFSLAGWLTGRYGQQYAEAWWIPAMIIPCVVMELGARLLNRVDPKEKYS